MTAYASASYSLAASMPDIDTLAKLRALLEPYADKPLVFHYGGRTIASGYHVTEVKAARLSSLDCGANPEEWSETIIQLWDVEEESATHMRAGKFLGILSQVAKRVAVDDHGLLVFEAGDRASPMQIFTVGAVMARGSHVEVMLAPRPATCKPRERGLEEAAGATTASCCGPAPTPAARGGVKKGCCG